MTFKGQDTAEASSSVSLRIENLSVGFKGRLVLKEINLELSPGGITVLVGPSGSGKSTLLRAVNRLNELFPGCQTSGTVRLRLDGRWIDAYRGAYPLHDLRRRAAMVFQNPNVLPVSIEKNLAIPLRAVCGLSAAEARDRMEYALVEVRLFEEVRDRLSESALTLSGGQQQRLCLARALSLGPSFLLLDEPTAGLDFQAARAIEALLERLREQYTVLAVSHSLSQTCRLARHVVVLREGRIVRELEAPQLADAELFRDLVEEAF
ncbi:MAG: phosphate ABC transporter ATP-binding protein [Planctomycetes bacterium]|nr:phosphate ABC transporter ATP-binding protein [Planctomycetota bacterium]